MNLENTLVVDVRSKEEFLSGHAKGSVNVPLEKILQRNILEIENSKKGKIVLVCNSGARANMAIMFLQKFGIKKDMQNLGNWRNVEK